MVENIYRIENLQHLVDFALLTINLIFLSYRISQVEDGGRLDRYHYHSFRSHAKTKSRSSHEPSKQIAIFYHI